MVFRWTTAYIEIQNHNTTPPFVTYAYVFPWRENALLIVAYLNTDKLFAVFEQQLPDPKMGTAYYKAYKKTWPNVIGALDNTLSNQFSKGVLLNMEDPDDGDRRWVIGTVVGNVSLNTPEELDQAVRSERMADAYRLVTTLSGAIVTELHSKKISRSTYATMAVKGGFWGAVGGYKQGIDLASTWVPKIAQVIKAVQG